MGFDCAFGQVEAAGGGGDIHLVEVIEGEDLAVFGREALDGFADGGALVAVFQAAVDGVRIGGLMDLVEGQSDGRKAAQFGAVEIGGKREEPGGEGGLLPPGGEFAIGAEEGLLGHLLGAATVAAEAVGEIDERRLPAADDALEGARVAGKNAGCVLLVFRGAGIIGARSIWSPQSSVTDQQASRVAFSFYARAEILKRKRNRTAQPAVPRYEAIEGGVSMYHIGPDVAVFFFLAVAAVAVFTFLAIATYSGNRQVERTEYYKAEMMKKIAEMGGERNPALEYLREQERIEGGQTDWRAQTGWTDQYRRGAGVDDLSEGDCA